MESFYFDTTLITISVIGLTSIAGVLTLKLIKMTLSYCPESSRLVQMVGLEPTWFPAAF